VAVVGRPDALRARRADEAFGAAHRLRDLLVQGRAKSLRARPTSSERRAETLVAGVRAAHDTR
jgi:hypothetical protein